MKKTMIVGATTNQSRYAWLASEMLNEYGHQIVPIGIKKGELFGRPILDLRLKPEVKDVGTITLYLNPSHQREWYDYLIGLKPDRIIFNPGTENNEFRKLAMKNGIEALEACTLVMLRTNQY